MLKQSANSLRMMKKSSTIELMVADMNDAVEEVHSALRSLQPAATNQSSGEERKQLISASDGSPASHLSQLHIDRYFSED